MSKKKYAVVLIALICLSFAASAITTQDFEKWFYEKGITIEHKTCYNPFIESPLDPVSIFQRRLNGLCE